jgi:hypothetical protein
LKDQEKAWLTILRDKGPQPISVLFSEYPAAASCLERGWTFWSGRLEEPEEITEAGKAALIAIDGGP